MTVQLKLEGKPVAVFQENKGAVVLNFPNILEIAEYLPHARFFVRKS